MNVSKVTVKTGHQIWCEKFLNEQNKTTELVRKFMKKNRIFNPLSDKTIDNLLKRYEKSFWG